MTATTLAKSVSGLERQLERGQPGPREQTDAPQRTWTSALLGAKCIVPWTFGWMQFGEWTRWLALVLLGTFTLNLAAEETNSLPPLTLEQIFTKAAFKTESWGPARWLKGASAYTVLEKSSKTDEGKDLVRYHAKSGKRRILAPAADLIPEGAAKPLKIEHYAWSDNHRKLLLFTNTKRVWRTNTRGDYWVFNLSTKQLRQLGGEANPSTLMFATFSPDGRHVAYVFEHNLYVQNVDTLRITPLTTNGSDTTLNGTADWVYEEEFGLRQAFRWSPDSQWIAYWQFDTSGVRDYTLVNYTKDLYPELTTFKYPKVGQTNSACRVGVVPVTGGNTQWFATGADPRNHYIPEMEWSPNSKFVVFQQLNRLQNTNRLMRGTVKTGRTKTIFEDADAAWLDPMEEWYWIEKGKRFLWLSERDGWRHLYAISTSDTNQTLLTRGEYDVTKIVGIDAKAGCVYFLASPENPTQRYLYRVSLEGQGEAERLTPNAQSGVHSYQLSDNGQWAFHTWSRLGIPPIGALVRLPIHQPMRGLTDNSELRAKLENLPPGEEELFRVDIGQGVQLDAWCVKPPGFDPAKKYPLLFYVYGEPAGQTVMDQWGGDHYLWHRLLASKGYVVMSVDNRGAPAPRGRDWRKCVYRQIGILASADQAAAVRKLLEERPYLDAKRVGIWGWSGGGSMTLNALFRYPDLYQTGMAIAFISNQLFYDTIYQERYMGLPADNEDGYRDGSPITFAHQLKGNLLLVHGTGDDNCHYQNCQALINELIKHNKLFSTMSYPNRTHSLREGENTRRHLFETLTRYLEEHLPPGP